jgi:hypothetical protein
VRICNSYSFVKYVEFKLLERYVSRIVLINELEEGVNVLAVDRDLELGNHVGHLVDC